MNKTPKAVVHPAILIAFFAMAFLIEYGFEKYSCYSYENNTNLKTKYTIMNGCLVDTKNGWRSLKTLRTFESNN
jgi:hypothetical protein